MQQLPLMNMPLGQGDLSAVAATLAPVLSAPGRAPVATPLHEKMQDPHFSQLMATWPEQLRRYAKRPQARRRGSSELSETERWYCPLQCGKYYKTTSTRSIAKHKGTCPKLPASTNSGHSNYSKEQSSQRSAATAATSLNPTAAGALATAAALGLLRVPPGSGPILPFPFPMLNPQLMLQILQNNPQTNASLQQAAAVAAANQQQQQLQHQHQHMDSPHHEVQGQELQSLEHE